MYFLNIITFLAVFVSASNALKCYSCTLALSEGDEDSDMACVNDPASAVGKPIITCPARMTFCTIVRNDYKDTNTVSSIQRNCAEDPNIKNEDIEGPDMYYHYRACTTDLCNFGTGLENPNIDPGEGGNLGGMVIPGLGAASSIQSSFYLIVVAIVTVMHLLFRNDSQ